MDNQELYDLADACMAGDRTRTPEKLWLREKFDRLSEKQSILKKDDLDRLVYSRVFQKEPDTASDVLKVRYWRTGRTIPVNRAVLLALGNALELTAEEMNDLILRYYDRNDRAFGSGDEGDPVWLERRQLMEELKKEFTSKLHPMYLKALHIRRENTEHFFRHLYYLESILYTRQDAWLPDQEVPPFSASHLDSASYHSTLQGLMRLEGEIPRRNMLRHLLVLMAPFVSLSRMNQTLQKLGFLPLQQEHHLPGGEQLDLLLIRLLEAYEAECGGAEPEVCQLWLRRTLCELDHYLEQKNAEGLRFMRFKSIARGGTGSGHAGRKSGIPLS